MGMLTVFPLQDFIIGVFLYVFEYVENVWVFDEHLIFTEESKVGFVVVFIFELKPIVQGQSLLIVVQC